WSSSSWTANAVANAADCVLFVWQDWLSEAHLFETHIWAARTVAGPEVEGVLSDAARPYGLEAESRAQCQVIRDIVANPFSLAKLGPSVLPWNGGTVKRLAEEAYQERLLPLGHLDPQRLGVLADALEEAGVDAELVEHLRGPGPHLRGCWVVDLLTG